MFELAVMIVSYILTNEIITPELDPFSARAAEYIDGHLKENLDVNRVIINTNIRFNLDNADDLKAYEFLQSMDRKQYKSYTKAVVIAINEYFEWQQRHEADS